MKEKYDWKQVIRNNMYLLKNCMKIAPKYIVLYMINSIYSVLIVFFEFTFGFNYILECAEFHRPFRYAFWYLAFLFCFVVLGLIYGAWINEKYKLKVLPVIKAEFKKQLYQKAKEVDLACYDDPEFYNRIILAISESDTQIDRIFILMDNIVTSIFTLILTGAFFIANDFVSLFFILALFIFSYISNQLNNKMNYEIKMQVIPLDRRREYVKRTSYLAEYAKEMRINTKLFDVCMDNFKDANEKIEQIHRKYAPKRFFVLFLKEFICSSFLHNVLYMIYLVYQAVVVGAISYSNVIVLYKAAKKVKNSLTSLATIYPYALENSLYIDRIKYFLQTETQLVNETKKKVAEHPQKLELKHVYFSYNNDEDYVLKDINMSITLQQSVALVGFNGAGKTTLTKLIMRLYDVTKGEILLDGVNIKEYDLEDYRRKISVVFQNFKIYAATLQENIILDLANGDEDKIEIAMKKSKFYERYKKLPKGLETELTKEFDNDGTNLSGGENQKVAITRIIYRDNPILILDEPSSALDPITEYELNKSMLELNKEKLVIFISHRLSTTRYQDQIYLLDQGQIVETGTHTELINLGGVYAKMWDLQAGNYVFDL